MLVRMALLYMEDLYRHKRQLREASERYSRMGEYIRHGVLCVLNDLDHHHPDRHILCYQRFI